MLQYQMYYESLWTEYKVDYLLLGEHFFCDDVGNIRNITLTREPETCLTYAKAVADKVVGSNIPVIIGSDCHDPCQVWDVYMDQDTFCFKKHR